MKAIETTFSDLGPDVLDFLLAWVRPRAMELDAEVEAIREGLSEMARRGLLGLRAGKEYGGMDVSDVMFRAFQEALARCSGALAFVQTQHQSAVRFLAQSPNEDLKKRYLPRWCSGERMSGIAFSQLRKPGKAVLSARKTEGGWILDGRMPWLTGWGIFQDCVAAALTEDGQTWFGVVEMKATDRFIPSEIMRLASMEVGQTVSAEVRELFVPDEDTLYLRDGNWIHDNDMINIALQSPFALGCAGAGIDVMREAFERKPIEAIGRAADILEEELMRCRTEAYAAMQDRGDRERSLRARAWAIELAGRCAHAAVAASGGQGNSVRHPAQRVYREALVFTVLAQTVPILEATLDRMTTTPSSQSVGKGS
ncbi:MAG: acyl-CoA dehydrogenase [Fimbriimonadales bacterium]|nr:MAG: acyl-CoA dehydrogenase [Fimbriimonadales bacterium]